jgi:ABC-type sugar transport system ATPase subunit
LATSVEVQSVSKRYERGAPALDAVSQAIEQGSAVGILGPSGSGKTTLLRLIAGLDHPDQGEIRFDGRSVRHVPPWRREVSLLGQTPALFPHLSVETNLALALHGRHWPRRARAPRIDALVHQLGIAGLRHRRPAELSGGERQRVALGRALAPARPLMLLDEPFVSLDTPLRRELLEQLARFHRDERFTLVLVSHDHDEAFALAGRVAVLCRGRIEQFDEPRTLHSQPRTINVARLTGDPPMNLLRLARLESPPHATLIPEGAPESPLHVEALGALRGLITRAATPVAGIRPEHFQFVTHEPPPGSSDWVLATIAHRVEYLGASSWLHATIGAAPVCVALRSRDAPVAGTPVRLAVDIRHICWFDAESGERLPSTARNGSSS